MTTPAAEKFYLTALGAGGAVDVELRVVSEVPPVISVRVGDEDARDYGGEDFFDCLLAARTELEGSGLLLCCQGARKFATPSGMTRQMSNGRMVYILRSKGALSDDDLVDIFAPADRADIVSVADQKEALRARFRGDG